MRKVYDFCSQRGVYPEISQFNRMMDWYTVEFRFGEVVSLACDMVGGGLHQGLGFNPCTSPTQLSHLSCSPACMVRLDGRSPTHPETLMN